jgi:predicted aspartyl protease
LALPSAGRGNTRGNNQPRNNNARPSYGRGQAYHVNMNEDQDQPATVMGTLPVNSVPVSVLFDSGASHSFISEEFAFMHGIKHENLHQPLVVNTPAGHCRTSMFSPDVTVEIEGLEFHAFPIILKSSKVDLILGMD